MNLSTENVSSYVRLRVLGMQNVLVSETGIGEDGHDDDHDVAAVAVATCRHCKCMLMFRVMNMHVSMFCFGL